MVKTEFAFLRWFASSATAKLARQQWRALSSVEAAVACRHWHLVPELCRAAITGDEPPPLGLRP